MDGNNPLFVSFSPSPASSFSVCLPFTNNAFANDPDLPFTTFINLGLVPFTLLGLLPFKLVLFPNVDVGDPVTTPLLKMLSNSDNDIDSGPVSHDPSCLQT